MSTNGMGYVRYEQNRPYGIPPVPAAPSRQREKITFPANTPVFLRIHGDPTPAAGRFGDQMMYVFDDNTRIAWLDLDVHAKIESCGAGPGDEIAIERREVKDGRKKRIDWIVERIADEPTEAAAPPQPPQQQPAAARPRPMPAPQGQPATLPASQAQGATPPPAAWPHPLATGQRNEPAPDLTFDAPLMIASINAAWAACARTTDAFGLGWDKNDVRALATTIYINRAKEGSR